MSGIITSFVGGSYGAKPGAPTIGTATITSAGTSASVTFTAPALDGGLPITSYTVTSSPGALTASGAGSPITVSGLTIGTSYTFTVTATNAAGTGPASAASNSVTAFRPAGQQLYEGVRPLYPAVAPTSTSFTWVCPTGVTSVSVVSVGAGGGGNTNGGGGAAGGGGGLRYTNNISVTPGNSYTVLCGDGTIIADPGPGIAGGDSSFNSAVVAVGGSGASGSSGGAGGTGLYNGGVGGNRASSEKGGGGGAAGYAGNGGAGGNGGSGGSNAPAGGGGGGGASTNLYSFSGGGGGVGMLGQGPSGTGGVYNGDPTTQNGTGGSGGVDITFSGGSYGGGGPGGNLFSGSYAGKGAVRIIWAGGSGITRAFPATNTGDL